MRQRAPHGDTPSHYAPHQDPSLTNRTSSRTIPLRVLSLGMPHASTASLTSALHILSLGPVYSTPTLLSNITDCDLWTAALSAKHKSKGKRFLRREFDQLLCHHAAATDIPAICFAPDLVDEYPDALVILPKRRVDEWYADFEPVLIDAFSWSTAFWAALDPWGMGRLHRMTRLWIECQFGATSARQALANARAVYEAHYELVRVETPMRRLLQYEEGSGWEPLCRFLGKEVPGVPFPRVNEAAVWAESMEELKSRGQARGLKNVLVFVMVMGTFALLVFVLDLRGA